MNYLLVGINHKTAPVAIREQVMPGGIGGTQVASLLSQLVHHPAISEATVLSTCNRVEFYSATENPDEAKAVMEGLLTAPAGMVYTKKDKDVIGHLFNVASSLDSLVMGENQITGQVKEAYQLALTQDATGYYLNKLFDRALFVAKRVKTETEIGKGNVSVGSVAVRLAKKIFGSLRDKVVVLVGTGETGELVVRYLATQDVGRVCLVNRTLEVARHLEEEGLGHAKPWSDLSSLIKMADIVITSIADKLPELSPLALKEIMQGRAGTPLFVIDLGVPRNVESEIGKLDDVYYYDIDDLESVAKENKNGRQQAELKAKNIIDEEVRLFYEKHLESDAVPVLARLGRKFEQIRQAELERTVGRLPHLSAADRQAIDRLTQGLVNRVLCDPILALKGRQDEASPTLISFFKKIFKLEDEG